MTDHLRHPRYARLTGTDRSALADQLRGAYETGQSLRMLVASTAGPTGSFTSC